MAIFDDPSRILESKSLFFPFFGSERRITAYIFDYEFLYPSSHNYQFDVLIISRVDE